MITIYLLINSYIIQSSLLGRADINLLIRFCSVNVFIKDGLDKINKLYYKIPIVHVLYNFPIRISNETIISSDNICQAIKDSFDINSLAKKLLVSGFENNTTTTKDRIYDKDVKKNLSGNPSIGKIIPIYNFIQKSLDDKNEIYFAVALQDESFLTPTGGVVSNILVFSVKEGKVNLIYRLTPSDIKEKFKGNVTGPELFNNINGLYEYDAAVDLDNKYKYIKTTLKEMYGFEINGIITIENVVLDELNGVSMYFQRGKQTYDGSISIYKLLLHLIDSKNIGFFFTDVGGEMFDNNSLNNSEKENFDACFNNNFSFIEIGKNKKGGNRSVVKLLGNLSKNNFTVDVYYSRNNVFDSIKLVIKSPKTAGGNVLNDKYYKYEKYYYDSGNYLIAGFTREPKNEHIVNYSVPINDCENGFGIKLAKQQGNDGLFINYEIKSEMPLYSYVNGGLTGRGNKFYNNGSVNLSEDVSLIFIK